MSLCRMGGIGKDGKATRSLEDGPLLRYTKVDGQVLHHII